LRPQTGFVEINGDLPQPDFWPRIVWGLGNR
jgi:membrane-associated protease RseP (regulator of RpoE activity)